MKMQRESKEKENGNREKTHCSVFLFFSSDCNWMRLVDNMGKEVITGRDDEQLFFFFFY